LAKVGLGRVLLTTFSKTLASRLQAQVDLLLAEHTEAVARVDVVHLHHRAVELWRESHGRSPRLPKPNDLVAIVMESMGDLDLGAFSNKFVEAEWEMVIEPHGITTWEEYAHVRRDTRSVPLGRAQRERLWPVFERMRELMAAQGLSTWSDICWQVALGIDEAGAPPYAHVIADEVQDFGPAELRLLRSLAAEGVNDVFLAGDAHQRIYKPRTSFSRAGLEVRGRSTVLRLNYRTTEQIRRAADRLIFGGSLRADGEDPAAVSVFAGPEPEFRTFATVKQEIEALATWLKKLVSNGYRPAEIGIVARTHQVVEDRARRAVAAAGLQAVDLENDSVDASKGVGLGTMHRAKGLQFRAVAVIGAERGMMPLESVLQRQPDEPAQRAFIERERNLLYVACTRSRERLFVTNVREPSEFLVVVGAVRA